MRTSFRPGLLVAVAAFSLLAGPRRARADWDFADWNKYVRLTGFLQPGFEYVQHSAPAKVEADPAAASAGAALDKVGFYQTRARVLGLGNWRYGSVDFDFRLEFEGLPQATLYDAYVAVRGTLAGGGGWRVVVGQHKAPFDRQVLVWDPDVMMQSKSWIAQPVANSAPTSTSGAAPSHQLGLSAQLTVPYANWLSVWVGVYNGEGRNQLENIDRNFMYVGRIAFKPIGPLEPTVESWLGRTHLSIAVDGFYNTTNLGDSDLNQAYAGADVFFAGYGVSAYARGVYGKNFFKAHVGKMAPSDYETLGYDVEVGYRLPIPGYLKNRFEVAGRFQGIVRDKQGVLSGYYDPNQATYDVAGGINYYQREHGLKIGVNYDHYFWPADRTLTQDVGADALFVRATYKLE